jgi:hypothetical protein
MVGNAIEKEQLIKRDGTKAKISAKPSALL